MKPIRNNLYTYRQVDSVKLECAVNLDKLFLTERERSKFDKKWEAFLKSDPNNKKIFRLEKNHLGYTSEQLIPEKVDKRPPLLLVLGNPASHSIEAACFFLLKRTERNTVSGKIFSSRPAFLN